MKITKSIFFLLFVLLAAAVLGPLSGQAASSARSGEYAVDDDYTVALLHMDESTFGFYDEIDKTWASGGDPYVDTALYRFPAGSGAFTGNDFLSTDPASDYQFGAGDWTIDFWIYLPTTPAVTQYLWWYGDEADDTDCMYLALLSDLTIQAGLAEGSDIDTITSTQTVPLTTWTHIAAARSGDGLYAFVGGVAAAGEVYNTVGVPVSSPIVEIGARYAGNYREGYFVGHLDEYRVTKGLARWVTDYSPPSMEYEPTPTNTLPPTATFTGTLATPTETLTPTVTSTPNYDVLYLGTGTPIAILEHSFTWGEVSQTIMMALICMVLVLGGLITFSIWAVAQRKK